jgi:hypothetical protein
LTGLAGLGYITCMNDTPTTPAASSSLRRRPLRRILKNWRERHRDPFNFWIHMLGIPLAVAGVFLFFFTEWYWALAALVGGYVLQWLGHLVEGNDVGEWAAIKRLLGLPYVGIAPQWQKPREAPSAQ